MSRWLLLVFVLALAARAAMLVDFMHAHPAAYVMQGDSAAYWAMAGAVASGKLIGPEPFLSAPLYPWFLGAIRLLGGGLLCVYKLQLMLHLLTAVMLGRIVSRRFDGKAGLVASIMFLLLMEPAFYITRILPTTSQLFVVVLVIAAADFAVRARTLRAFAALGAILGAFALIYPTAILLLAILPLWTLWIERNTSRNATNGGLGERPFDRAWEKASVATFLGCLIVLPATLHNWAASGEFIPITAHGGITLRQGNAPQADGIYTPIPGISATRERMHADALALYERETGTRGSYGDIDRFFQLQAWQYLSADWGRAVHLVVRKFYWFVTGRHYSDIVYPTLEQADGWIHLLWLAPIHTSWLMGPAFLGLIVGLRDRLQAVPVSSRSAQRHMRQNLWDFLLVLLPLMTVCLFWYSPRYRAPILPMLVVFAVNAIHGSGAFDLSMASFQPALGKRSLLFVVVLLLVGSMLTGPINSFTGFDRADAYRPQYEHNRGQVYVSLRRFDLAVPHFEESDRGASDHPQVLAALADAYAQTSRMADAVKTAQRLVRIDPGSAQGWLVLGGLHLRDGQWSPAVEAFQRALDASPRDQHAHLGLAMSLANFPDESAETERHFRESLRLSPGDSFVFCELGRWLFHQGRFAEAETLLRPCVQANPARPDTAEMLTQLNAVVGTPDRRLESLRAAIAKSPENAELYSQLAGDLFRAGNTTAAIGTLREGVLRARDNATMLLELAWVLATTPEETLSRGSGVAELRAEAVTFAEQAVSAMQGPAPEALDVLAAAYASVGRFTDAQSTARRAYNLAIDQGDEPLALAIGERLANYAAGRPYGRD